jgi:hypothetical protein
MHRRRESRVGQRRLIVVLRSRGRLLAERRLVISELRSGRNRSRVLDKFKITNVRALKLKKIVFDSRVNEKN